MRQQAHNSFISLVINPAAAPRATGTGVCHIVEQVPALMLGVAKHGERKDAGNQVEVLEHQSSESESVSESLLATGAWSLSDQRLASKAAQRKRVKMGKMIR